MDDDWWRKNANKILNWLLLIGAVGLIMVCLGVVSTMMEMKAGR